jgi:hypothetical protein
MPDTATIQISSPAYPIGTPLRLLVDVTDPTGDTDLNVPKGTLVRVWSDEVYCLIVELMDRSVSFPVEYEDVAPDPLIAARTKRLGELLKMNRAAICALFRERTGHQVPPMTATKVLRVVILAFEHPTPEDTAKLARLGYTLPAPR